MPRCIDCLSEDVTTHVTGMGCDAWFCAEDWEANQAEHEAFMKMVEDATRRLEGDLENWKPTGLILRPGITIAPRG